MLRRTSRGQAKTCRLEADRRNVNQKRRTRQISKLLRFAISPAPENVTRRWDSGVQTDYKCPEHDYKAKVKRGQCPQNTYTQRSHDRVLIIPRGEADHHMRITSGLGPWTSEIAPWTLDLGPCTFGPWTAELGPRTLDLESWTLDFENCNDGESSSRGQAHVTV